MSQANLSCSDWLKAFQERQAEKHKPKLHPVVGEHPKHTGIGKKDTTFYPGCCNVCYDRQKLPKSGKSIVDGCFIRDKGTYKLVYDISTRALLGLDINKIKQYKELLNEQFTIAQSN